MRKPGRSSPYVYAFAGLAVVGCSRRPGPSESAPPAAFDAVPPRRVIATWFDAAAVGALKDAWKAFDMAELQAIALHEEALGEYVDVLAVPAID
jgi:hypothetical protein